MATAIHPKTERSCKRLWNVASSLVRYVYEHYLFWHTLGLYVSEVQKVECPSLYQLHGKYYMSYVLLGLCWLAG